MKASPPNQGELAGLTRAEKVAFVRRLAAERASRTRTAPLSFAQQRMWFLDQLEPGNPYNNICRAYEIRGALDTDSLCRSLAEVVGRHGALRTRFPVLDGKATQRVATAETPFETHRVDLTGLPPEIRQHGLNNLLHHESRHAFDLEAGPLLRTLLVRKSVGAPGQEEHVLVLSVHHIVFDGWSLGIFLGEMALGYASFLDQRPSQLPPPRLEYTQYARDERRRLEGKPLEELVEWWRRELDGAATRLALPADRPRPKVEGYRGTGVRLALPEDLAHELGELGRRSGATLFMTLLAGFGTLLGRSACQTSLLVGTPVARRDRTELEGIIGLFANTLVLRLELSGSLSFAGLLGRLRRRALDAYAHQDLPFERLVEEIASQRDLSRNPLFQVMFALHNLPAGGHRLPGLELRPLAIKRGFSKMDLTLDATEVRSGIDLYFELTTELFDPTTIERLARQFRTLLTAAAADPERPIHRLPMLSNAERVHLVLEWNDTRRSTLLEPTLHELLGNQVRQTPEAAALVDTADVLSYRELAHRAGETARRLAALGVGPEVRVGVFLPRSKETVVALLGVLQAGGVYVPLDPELPERRLAFFVEDTAMPVILTRGELWHRLPAAKARVLLIESSEAGEDDVCPAARSDNAAYVIYTSGSTGRPKGVAVTHGAAVRHAAGLSERYLLRAGDRVLQFASPSFDVAFEEIFPTWFVGGTLVLRPASLSLVLDDFLAFVHDQRLTVLNLPTPYWHEWAAALPDAAPPPGLRLVVVGTERALPERVESWWTHLGRRIDWINSYGCTEATITSTAGGISAAGKRVSVGRPVPRACVHVVDDLLTPVPIGVTGELMIGGDALARGYLARPRTSAGVFVPDPFALAPGRRLYASGDRARLLADGELELFGRADDQIKVRGFRVELGEVEATLASLEGVREGAVHAQQEPGASWRLVACAVPEPGAVLSAEGLRRGFAAELPAYMVPASFTILDALPRTPGGKVDRDALDGLVAAAQAPERPPGNAYQAPRSPMEELLAETWSEVLGCGPVSIHDDFFDLGGHSLTATRVVSRLRRTLGREVALKNFFETPTVAALAARLAVEDDRTESVEPPLVARPRDGRDLPLSFAQQRLWFLDQLEPGQPVYNVAVPARLVGDLDPRCLAGAFRDLGERHESLRTTFSETAGQPAQIVHPRLRGGLPRVDLDALPEQRREACALALAVNESRRGFDLVRGPLVRTALLRLGPRDHVLVLVLHHIVTDGWSVDVLLRELQELYQAGVEQRSPRLPALGIQYADFACWQREWLRDEALESELVFWRERLGGVPPPLELPVDRPRPAFASYHGARCYLALPAGAGEQLRYLGRTAGATLFMSLTAAFKALLHRYSGQAQITLGTPIAGRHRGEVEGVVGCFVNTLVLSTRLAGGDTFREVLEHEREESLAAYGHQDLPFEHLVEDLRPERDMARNPLFQVLFVLQNTAAVTGHALGSSPPRRDFTLELLSLDNRIAHLDLVLNMWPTRGDLHGFLEYSTDLFDATSAARTVCHFRNLLAGLAANPEIPIAELPLLGAAQRHQLLTEWNAAPASPAPEGLLHSRFWHKADERPDEPAVIAQDRTLTHRELRQLAAELGHRLREAGARPNRLVGVVLPKGWEQVVAVLGVLHAGAAYLPLDPALPKARLDALLEHGEAELAVAHGDVAEGLAVRQVLPVVDVGDRPQRTGSPPSAATSDLAYVIFTSGSTGFPKGVVIEHRSALNTVVDVNERFAVGANDRVFALSSLSFDLSVYDVFGLLAAGGTIVVPPPEDLRDPARWLEWMRRERVTVWDTVPALMQMLVDHLELHGETLPKSLRLVLMSGDWIPVTLPQRIRALAPGQAPRIISMGGATEASIWSILHPIEEVDPAWTSIPYGRPMANQTWHVLDAHLEPRPIGAPGDLVIGGAGLAQGYWRDEEKTQASFLRHPGGRGRLYRTGDLGRYLPDGSIEFLGREDFQVKVQGHRIELGEIETVLLQHPAVRAAVVMALGEARGAKRLVGWVVTEEGAEIPLLQLRDYLGGKLPEYMVPASLHYLDALPLTANGKVDRSALPTESVANEAEELAFVAPRTPAEEQLAGIWAEVLGLERVGVHEDFFDLGGHSLAATQVLARVRRDLSVELSLRVLFDTPTVAGLAEAMQQQAFASADEEALANLLAELEEDLASPSQN